MLRTLLHDRRGNVALTPAYVILCVLLLGAISTALLLNVNMAQRGSADSSVNTSLRNAVSIMEAELNTKPVADIVKGINDGKGQWVPSTEVLSDYEAVRYISATPTSASTSTTTIRVYMESFTAAGGVGLWTEYASKSVVFTEPDTGRASVRKRWEAVRTLSEGEAP